MSVVLGGIGYVKTQPAAIGPLGPFLGAAPQAPVSAVTLQQPTLAWVVGAQGEQQLNVRFQIENIDAASPTGIEYTIAIGDSTRTLKALRTRMAPPDGKVNVLVPMTQIPDISTNTIVVTLHSTQDGAHQLPQWHGALPPQP